MPRSLLCSVYFARRKKHLKNNVYEFLLGLFRSAPSFSLFPGQLPDPLPRPAPQKCRHALKKLVRVEAPHHHCRRCLHHECHKKRQRQHDQPDADQVHLYHEHGVPAAPDDPGIGGHLVGHPHVHGA